MPAVIRGVYTITCKVNGRRYVGSSSDVRQRWASHRSGLRRGKHECTALQADWNEHGPSAFEFHVVATARDPILRLAAEQAAIDEAIAEGLAYNLCPTAGNSTGLKHTVETRQRMSASALTAWQEGRRSVSPEQRERIAAIGRSHKGKPMPPEVQAALLAANKGKPRSAETRRRISEAQKGRTVPPERRAAISAAMTGRTLTEQHRQKISDGQRGRPGHTAKLTADNVREIKRRLAAGESGRSLVAAFGVSEASISDIKNGRTWRHVT